VVDLLLALLLVFAVMASLFESVQQALALMAALPFALAGAFWTLWITGTDFDQPAASDRAISQRVAARSVRFVTHPSRC